MPVVAEQAYDWSPSGYKINKATTNQDSGIKLEYNGSQPMCLRLRRLICRLIFIFENAMFASRFFYASYRPAVSTSVLSIAFAFLATCFFPIVENAFAQPERVEQAKVLTAYRSGVWTRDEFKLVSNFVKTSKGAKWQTIPWISGLWEGVEASQASNKPMFIWAMNGDPLGCV